MISNNTTKVYSTKAKLTAIEKESIKVYMLGAVRGFCNANPTKPFSVRILFGGGNRDWHGTPMQSIYNYFLAQGYSEEDAATRAAQDAGYLLKETLLEDNYKTYKIDGKDTSVLYCLDA